MTKKKKQVTKTFENKAIIIIAAIVIFLFVLMITLWVKRGTYAVGGNETNVEITCPSNITAGSNIICDVTLNLDGSDTILSVNANYDLADEIDYVSFELDNECETSCFEIYASTENGFALVNMDGVTESVLLGHLTLDIPEDITTSESYKVGLKNIELSDSEFVMHTLENSSINITIGGDAPGPITTNETVTRIKDHTTYGELKTTLGLGNDVTLISNDGNAITDEDIVKTGDQIQLANGNTLTLSVLGDVTGDGQVKVNDVGKMYRHVMERQIITDPVLLASGDVVQNNEVKINDVGRAYRYVMERITSLEVIE